MSTHSDRAQGRHPNPTSFKREVFHVAHVTFEVCDHPKNGATFALIAGNDPEATRRKMFSGYIESGMGTQLRRLAHRIDELEPKK